MFDSIFKIFLMKVFFLKVFLIKTFYFKVFLTESFTRFVRLKVFYKIIAKKTLIFHPMYLIIILEND